MYTYVICVDGETSQRSTVLMWVMEMELMGGKKWFKQK